MTMSPRIRLHAATALATACLAIAACGGGGSDGDDVSAAPPQADAPVPPATPGAGACGDMQELLAALNAARAQARSCGDTQMPAAAPLRWNAALAQAAERQSRDMAAYNRVDHTGTDGSTLSTRVTDAGYAWSSLAENLAAGRPTATATVQQWLESPPHCKGMMDQRYVDVGGACAFRTDGYRYYWTIDLGHP